jgi:thiol-disulfide isomerase/thioredoxin
MRSIVAAVLAVGVLAGCTSTAEPRDTTDIEPGWAVPCAEAGSGAGGEADDFAGLSLPCLADGDEHTVAAWDDRPLLITLWASWCMPCAAEAPELQRFHTELGDQVAVLGIDTQDTRDKGRYFAEDFSWTFPSLYDERGQVLHTAGLSTLPATFLIDTDGRTVARFTQGDLTAEQLTDAAAEELGVRR